MKQRGFTIVELLIVIVVIGILAAIVVVAYNGVQQRAKNSQVQSATGQYVKLLSLYLADNPFPIDTSGSTNISCLDGGYTCNPAYSSTKTDQLKAAILTKSNKLPAFPNTLSLLNYSTVAKDSGGTYNGWYFLIQQYGQAACGSIGGTTYLNTTMNGNDRQCRYALDQVG